jgi:hypothetical protein
MNSKINSCTLDEKLVRTQMMRCGVLKNCYIDIEGIAVLAD